MDKTNTEFYYVNESLFGSVIADLVTFGAFALMMTLNYKIWNGDWYVTVFLLILWILFTHLISKRKTFKSKEELVKYLQEEQLNGKQRNEI